MKNKPFLTLSRLRGVFEHATVGVLVADAEGNIAVINSCGAALFGYAADELAGQLVDRLLSEPLRVLFAEHRKAFMRYPTRFLKSAGLFFQAKRKDGSLFPVDISLSHFTEKQQRWLVAFIINQTPDEQAMNQAITKSRAQSSELHDVRKRLMSMVSHEFRTPLSAILSSVSLIKRYAAPEHQERRAKHLANVEEAVQQLTQLLDDLVLVPEEDNRQFTYFAPTQVISEAIAIAQRDAKAGQELRATHVGEDSVYLAPVLLQKVIRHLLSNATKFSPEKAVISVTSQKQPDFFEVTVQDPGIGILPADIPHLGEQFFRGSNAGDTPGRGLGLYAVNRFLPLLEGEIFFKSVPNKGTTVRILFCHVHDLTH